MVVKLGLASNFQNECHNIRGIWELFGPYVDQWLVVDSGSTDDTEKELQDIVKDKLVYIKNPMIKVHGYAYSRTKLIELSEGMDWVFIIDGDERMCPFDAKKMRDIMDKDPPFDIIWMPRIYYLDSDKQLISFGYGSHSKEPGPYKFEAIHFHPDWQARLIRRTMIENKSKIQFRRAVHEVPVYPEGTEIRELRDLGFPIIEHFSMAKSLERRQEIAGLCNSLANRYPDGLEEFNGKIYNIDGSVNYVK